MHDPSHRSSATSGLTSASGMSLVNSKTTASPSRGRSLPSVSLTTSGSSSLLPTVPSWPFPDHTCRAAGDVSSGRVRSPPHAMSALPSKTGMSRWKSAHSQPLSHAKLCITAIPRKDTGAGQGTKGSGSHATHPTGCHPGDQPTGREAKQQHKKLVAKAGHAHHRPGPVQRRQAMSSPRSWRTTTSSPGYHRRPVPCAGGIRSG